MELSVIPDSLLNLVVDIYLKVGKPISSTKIKELDCHYYIWFKYEPLNYYGGKISSVSDVNRIIHVMDILGITCPKGIKDALKSGDVWNYP